MNAAASIKTTAFIEAFSAYDDMRALTRFEVSGDEVAAGKKKRATSGPPRVSK
jgi:hypothetical protein